MQKLLCAFIGDIDEFYQVLRPILEEFFYDFGKHFFISNDQINRRRNTIYRKIVNSKACTRNPFKRQMMIELVSDIESCIVDSSKSLYQDQYIYSGSYTDTVENRRKLFVNFIKNYIYRLFLIDEKVSELLKK